MGHALYSTAPDYLKFCRMILRDGELDGAASRAAQAAPTPCGAEPGIVGTRFVSRGAGRPGPISAAFTELRHS